MEGRWRGQRPFERGRARTPWIVCRLLLAHERVCYAEEEYQCAESREIRAERRDEVPAGESIGVVSDATRHAGEPKEMLGKEDNVDANEGQPEVQLADRLRIHVAGDDRQVALLADLHWRQRCLLSPAFPWARRHAASHR